MKPATSLTFNIIFVPGTVRILRLAVVSLLHNSTCGFRIVSNGCDENENRILRKLCRDHPQLEFMLASQTSVIPHGDLLTRLQSDERSPHFAFIDSDIFASGDFVEELTPFMRSADAIFACPPIWITDELLMLRQGSSDQKETISQFDEFDDTTCLGSSYFAIYDNVALTKCMNETGVSLRRYCLEEIPPTIQDELRHTNKLVDMYDTGKLLNMLMELRGFHCRIIELDSLCHLGGISAAMISAKHGHAIKRRMSAIMPDILLKILRCAGLYNGRRDRYGQEERRFTYKSTKRRQKVCKHFNVFFEYLARGTGKPPAFRDQDSQLVSRVRQAEELLGELYQRYGDDAEFSALAQSTANHRRDTTLLSN